MKANISNSNLYFNKDRKDYKELKNILDKIPSSKLMNNNTLNQLQKVPQIFLFKNNYICFIIYIKLLYKILFPKFNSDLKGRFSGVLH